MFSRRGRGRGRGRGGSYGGPRPLKGIFVDGAWQCNCNPRLPAERFKVRKESKNQGRWFYTCQKPEGQRCDFFLWDDDAKPREEAAVLSNSRSEPEPAPYTSANVRANASRALPSPSRTLRATTSSKTVNHADSETEGEEEEAFPWQLTGEEEAQLSRKADAVSPPPITPHKPVITNGLATPVTGKRKLYDLDDGGRASLSTPSTSKRINAGLFDMTTPQTTPTPSRFKDALATPEYNFDLNLEVMNVLQLHNARLDDEVRKELRELLHRSTLRIQGIVKGRDISRLQIKAKDAKIAEQQLRITTLEAELEAERAVIQHLRWEMQNGSDAG